MTGPERRFVAAEHEPAVELPALTMLTQYERVLDDLAEGVGPTLILQDLCVSARELLAADIVSIQGAAGSAICVSVLAEAEQAKQLESLDVASKHVPVIGPEGVELMTLRVVWNHQHVRDPDFDDWALGRYARMISVVVQRHLARRQLQLIEAREREQLAGTIHDDPMQAMTAVSLGIQLMARRADPEVQTRLAELRQLTDQASNRLRRLMFVLHPDVIEEQGLGAALQSYFEHFVAPTGVEWSLTDRSGADLPFETACLMFRLAHAVIANVLDDSPATRLTIDIGRTPDAWRVEINHEAVGADTTHADEIGGATLTRVAVLARAAGGRITLAPDPGRGSSTVIELPVL